MQKLLAALAILAAAMPVHASEYGCKVLLCLANPASNGGPKGVAECVPPIDQLYHDLAHGRPFPTCDLADGNNGSSYARQVFDPYDPCPAPLQPAPRGMAVVQGERSSGVGYAGWWGRNASYTLAGQPQVSESGNLWLYSAGARACVGNALGAYTVDGNDGSYTVNVFDKVTWQRAQNPRAIDVYIDGKWYQRVRW